MTNTSIAAKLAAKAAQPKPVHAAAPDVKPDPKQRILDSYIRTTEKDVLREQKVTRERDKAIMANLPNALGVMDEDLLRDIFVGLEGFASASQRKLIATHPLRPEGVEELVEKVDAARAKEAEKAKAQREAERRQKEREKYELLKKKFEADGSDTATATDGETET